MSPFTHERPCAAPGLRSYRYRGAYGFVMIGARDDEDALREAARSLCYESAAPERLDAWDEREGRYKPVDQGAKPSGDATKLRGQGGEAGISDEGTGL